MRTAVIPGSFDPVTLGHIDLIRRAGLLFEHVLVVAMVNEDKHYHLTEEQRLVLLKQSVADIPNAEADFWGGMLWEYVRNHHACAVVKGIRNELDFNYEIEMAAYNRVRGVETVFLPALPEYRELSSTEARRRLDAGASLAGVVTPNAEILLRDIWKKERKVYGGNTDR